MKKVLRIRAVLSGAPTTAIGRFGPGVDWRPSVGMRLVDFDPTLTQDPICSCKVDRGAEHVKMTAERSIDRGTGVCRRRQTKNISIIIF
jgi:hypothetical protein